MVSGIKIFAVVLGLGYLVVLSYEVNSQSIPEQGNTMVLPSLLDCSEVNIEYADDSNLTRAEKVALMDEALLRSLSKFDNCNISQLTSRDINSSSSSGLEQNTGGGSIASSDMSGTDISKIQLDISNKGNISSNVESQIVTDKDEVGNGSPSNLERSLDNGKIPEDLLYADNDSVLQAQIRKAAINEKDPQVRAKLWNEYRKYKSKPKVE